MAFGHPRLMLDYLSQFDRGLPYEQFLARHGTEAHRQRWAGVHAAVKLSEAQRQLLDGFQREMKVLCLAGAWCGDCVNQCPIFDHFARTTNAIQLRFFDRDVHADLSEELKICGGARIPIVVFTSEDGQQAGWYGDRTLSKYRQMAVDQLGPSCPTGLITPDRSLLDAVTQDWLNEFERVQLLLRLSPRLRSRHHD
jgi:thiol-disulfide isomerase/thioredoxin